MNKLYAESITNRIIDTLCKKMHVTDPNDIEFRNNYQKHESYKHNNSDIVEVLTMNGHSITSTSLKIHYIGNDKYCLSHRELCSVLSNDEAEDAVVIVECIDKVLIMRCTELCKEVQRNKENIKTKLMSLLLPSKDINQEIINVTMIDELWK